MPAFSINDGGSTSFADTSPVNGFIIDFSALDNSFNVTINGVPLFVGGPVGRENELEFQIAQTAGQTVRFADGDEYVTDTPEIWQLGNTNGQPIVRLEVNPDGSIALSGVKTANGPLEPLELFNGMQVNSAAIAAAWNTSGPNNIVVDQELVGPTGASGSIEDMVCFAAGTLIETERGCIPIELLRVGDCVRTLDGGMQPIRWIGSRALGAGTLRSHDKLRPVRIMAGALGADLPRRDMLVSRQHRMLVSSAIARRMFEVGEVLIPAIKLTALPGVFVDDAVESVEYFHLLFDNHEVIFADGAPAESLLTGPQAMQSLSPDARAEIHLLFPELLNSDHTPKPARFIPPGKKQKQLVERHRKNQKAICYQLG